MTYDLNPYFSARKNNNSLSSVKEELEAVIYNYPATYTGDNTVFEQSYFFTDEQQVFTPATTTTTSTTTTTTTTTAGTTAKPTTTTTTDTTTAETGTEPNTETTGIMSAQSHDRQSAASAHNSLPHVTLCVTMFVAWVVKQ